jgi:hypothetical protein
MKLMFSTVAIVMALTMIPASAQKTDPTKPAGVNTVNEKLKEINNPPRSDAQSGRVIEERVPPKVEPRPRD